MDRCEKQIVAAAEKCNRRKEKGLTKHRNVCVRKVLYKSAPACVRCQPFFCHARPKVDLPQCCTHHNHTFDS